MPMDATGNSVSHLPTINVKKIVDVWEWIEFRQARDDEPVWLQASWTGTINTLKHSPSYYTGSTEQQALLEETNYCGTSFCVAGYVAREWAIHGARGVLSPNYVTNPEGHEVEVYDWDSAGQHALGLTRSEAISLFDSRNTKETIREKLNAILANRGEEIVL